MIFPRQPAEPTQIGNHLVNRWSRTQRFETVISAQTNQPTKTPTKKQQIPTSIIPK
jgi:hypothetical protein